MDEEKQEAEETETSQQESEAEPGGGPSNVVHEGLGGGETGPKEHILHLGDYMPVGDDPSLGGQGGRRCGDRIRLPPSSILEGDHGGDGVRDGATRPGQNNSSVGATE